MGFHYGKENARFVILCRRECKEMLFKKAIRFVLRRNINPVKELRLTTKYRKAFQLQIYNVFTRKF